MKIIKLQAIHKYTIPLFYIILFVLTSLYVFVANDESQPILTIFELNYLLPVLIYASGGVGLSVLIFLFLKRKYTGIFSLLISVIVGLPLGLLIVSAFFILMSQS